jgi:transcriptional regulator with XRE-family HTH domain
MARPPSPDKTIGERIKARRQLRTWSIRHAADRAGLSHASWSRIERGLQAADNRFVLANIAAALECEIADLTGTPAPAADRSVAIAQAGVAAVRQALIDLDMTDSSAAPCRPLPTLTAELASLRKLRNDCDYAGTVASAAPLLRDLHAACSGPDRQAALHLLCEATHLVSSLLRSLGHPADAWLGAERCGEVALELEDPVWQGLAAFTRASAAVFCGSHARGLALAERGADDLMPEAGTADGLQMLGMLHLISAVASRAAGRAADSTSWASEAARLAGHTGETTTLALYFGPTNVNLWRVGIELDYGDPGRAAAIATSIDVPAARVNSRLVFFHTDLARAYVGLPGHDDDAVRHLLIAERIAPQHVHSSATVRKTTRALLDRVQRRAAGSTLRGLCERMQVAH